MSTVRRQALTKSAGVRLGLPPGLQLNHSPLNSAQTGVMKIGRP
jgi:hypothetical protein